MSQSFKMIIGMRLYGQWTGVVQWKRGNAMSINSPKRERPRRPASPDSHLPSPISSARFSGTLQKYTEKIMSLMRLDISLGVEKPFRCVVRLTGTSWAQKAVASPYSNGRLNFFALFILTKILIRILKKELI